nr:uncharacterized protein LOC107974624 [Pan troglodytes]
MNTSVLLSEPLGELLAQGGPEQRLALKASPGFNELTAFLFYNSLFGDVANNLYFNKMDKAVKRIGFCPGLQGLGSLYEEEETAGTLLHRGKAEGGCSRKAATCSQGERPSEKPACHTLDIQSPGRSLRSRPCSRAGGSALQATTSLLWAFWVHTEVEPLGAQSWAELSRLHLCLPSGVNKAEAEGTVIARTGMSPPAGRQHSEQPGLGSSDLPTTSGGQCAHCHPTVWGPWTPNLDVKTGRETGSTSRIRLNRCCGFHQTTGHPSISVASIGCPERAMRPDTNSTLHLSVSVPDQGSPGNSLGGVSPG